MEHTNLFLFEDREALEAAYPDGKIVTPVPAVAYARPDEGEERGTFLFNKKKVSYSVLLHLVDKSGTMVGEDVTVESSEVLEGKSAIVNIVAPEVEDYKPKYSAETIRVSADTEHDVVYLGLTSYTVTVHHMFEGEPLSADTEIETSQVYEEESVSVTIEPIEVPGYSASPVTIRVSGDCEYTLEYEEAGPAYEAIDLGLPSGTLWCSCNVGASSPEEYGDYFAWGEIEPNKATAYTEENYRFYAGMVETGEYTKYNSNDELEELELVDDAAHVIMGGDWHIPSQTQMDELLNNTTSSWTTDYNGTGVAGVIFTSTANTNSIFLPAAGVNDEGLQAEGNLGIIWANIVSSKNNTRAWTLQAFNFDSSGVLLIDDSRYAGISVRGVIGEDPELGPLPEEPIMA